MIFCPVVTLTLAGLLASSAAVDTVHGLVVFTRHGGRSTKHYGAQALTSLGATQNFQVGSDYRARYLASDSPYLILNISEFSYVSSQDINDQVASQTLNNGSRSEAPLDGYQYGTLQGVNTKFPDTTWIKGSDGCPAYTKASNSFQNSAEFASPQASTRDFYRHFFPVPDSVYDYTSADNPERPAPTFALYAQTGDESWRQRCISNANAREAFRKTRRV